MIDWNLIKINIDLYIHICVYNSNKIYIKYLSIIKKIIYFKIDDVHTHFRRKCKHINIAIKTQCPNNKQ